MRFIDQLPWAPLVIVAVFMLMAPFKPMPHVVEKLMMLKEGTLNRPIDIFDLFFHLTPLILVVIKLVRAKMN